MGAAMGRNMIAGVVAAAAAGWLSLTYAREAMTRAPAPTAPSSPSAQGQPAPVDIVEGRDGWLYPGWDYLVDERPAETASAIEQIVKMAEAARARGSRVIVLLIPNKARVHHDRLPEDRAAWTAQYADGFEQLAVRLRDRGIEVETVWPQFSPRDAHWTGEAGEAAARQLATRLAAFQRSKGPKLPVPRWVEERRLGDLAALAKSRGDLRWSEDVFQRRDYVPPIPGKPTVEVVGNSFIDTYYGFPQELSRQLHAAVEHRVSYSGQGPWRAMRDYLANGEPRAAVIWQIQETSVSSFTPGALP